MKDKQFYFGCLFIIILFSVFGCQTLSLYGKTGLIAENRSSHDVRIESLKKITFSDRTTLPWEKSYQYYIHKIDAKMIAPGETKRFNIADGYYGIEICDGKFCTYTNFYFKKVILLIIEDGEGRGQVTYRFDD